MSILKNNWHWLLLILIILGGISIILFTKLNNDAEPKTVYKQPSEETLQNIRDKIAAQKGQEIDDKNKPPPPGASPDGHWHNGEWHDKPHTTKPNGVSQKEKQPSFRTNYLSASIPLPFGVTYAELGLEIPPKGYRYVWEKERVPKLDENGDPILLKEGEPYIEILYETGFAPSPEQLNQYMKLKGKYYAAHGWGRTAEAERLKLELKEFKTKAMGKVPGAVLISGGNSGDYSGKRRAKLKEAYTKLGLGHLYDYIITGQISH